MFLSVQLERKCLGHYSQILPTEQSLTFWSSEKANVNTVPNAEACVEYHYLINKSFFNIYLVLFSLMKKTHYTV